ncbi:MAG TPA: hypothetical protein VFQ35_19385, partial [Polyangiaceae bacterium]|nr:hypothetical protein [Polyangiaceae bacterium]
MKRLFGCTLVAALFANAPLHAEPSRILGTDDARDCALANDGTVVGATAGGLVVFGAKRGAKVLTALEGLPDTRVESVRIEGGYAEIQTKSGASRVRLGDLQVEPIGGELTPRPPSMPSDPFRARAEQRSAEGRCLATDHGVFFATGTKGLERVPLAGLP